MDSTSPKVARFLRSFTANALDGETLLFGLIEGFIAADLRIAAHGVIRIVRSRWRDRSPQPERIPPVNPELPSGPYRTVPEASSILIFVPRNLEGRLIDDLTGSYGYSHIAVDLGEIDLLTGKRVMIEAMMHAPVQRVFQNRYGNRPFIRVPLKDLGIAYEPFRDCVLRRLGDRYDYEEALTWGRVHDPARQICTDVVTESIPDELRHDIARKRREGAFRHSQVSYQRYRKHDYRVFITPNAFAMYFGAPRGDDVVRPDTLVQPKVFSTTRMLARRASGYASAAWTVVGLSGTALLGWGVMRVLRRR